MKSLIAPLLSFAVASLSAEPLSIPIWPEGVPGGEGKQSIEEVSVLHQNHEIGDYTRVSQVHSPSIDVYLPAKMNPKGAGVVVLPGGGFRFLSMDLEGSEIAHQLNVKGIAAFVLKYRLPREEGSTYTIGDTVDDAHRAIRLARSRAKEWGVNPNRIGAMGFSASGRTIGEAAANFDYGDPEARQPLDRISSRPDFQILVYGGYVYEQPIPEDTPPAFLVCAHNDGEKPSIAIKAYSALLEKGIPAELHIYQSGGHAYGMRYLGKPVNTWNERLYDWMEDLGVWER